MANTADATRTRPRVVFDPKMPRYEYREGEGHSLSVDRKRATSKPPAADLLANVKC